MGAEALARHRLACDFIPAHIRYAARFLKICGHPRCSEKTFFVFFQKTCFYIKDCLSNFTPSCFDFFFQKSSCVGQIVLGAASLDGCRSSELKRRKLFNKLFRCVLSELFVRVNPKIIYYSTLCRRLDRHHIWFAHLIEKPAALTAYGE